MSHSRVTGLIRTGDSGPAEAISESDKKRDLFIRRASGLRQDGQLLRVGSVPLKPHAQTTGTKTTAFIARHRPPTAGSRAQSS